MKKHNRRYKDSVFVDLFSEDRNAKSNFLALYNVLHHTNYQSTAILKNIRLKQVLYMTFHNDVSYLVDNKIIVLAEHQSTVNPNMPIRFLEYVTRLYEGMQKPRDRYSRMLKKIPPPEFFVFYNGKDNLAAHQTLKLSDAFTIRSGTPQLELVVQLININYDKGNPVLRNCKPLKEYSLFVEMVRRHIALNKDHGFENAIKECIKNDILREYLQRKSREVMNMLLAEYDYDTDIAVQRAEEREIAFAEGEARGSHQTKLETAKTMLTMGYPLGDICKISGLSQDEVQSIGNV